MSKPLGEVSQYIERGTSSVIDCRGQVGSFRQFTGWGLRVSLGTITGVTWTSLPSTSGREERDMREGRILLIELGLLHQG